MGRIKAPAPAICEQCGEPFTSVNYSRFCKDCKVARHREQKYDYLKRNTPGKHYCQTCGTEIKGRKRQYCTPKCRPKGNAPRITQVLQEAPLDHSIYLPPIAGGHKVESMTQYYQATFEALRVKYLPNMDKQEYDAWRKNTEAGQEFTLMCCQKHGIIAAVCRKKEKRNAFMFDEKTEQVNECTVVM